MKKEKKTFTPQALRSVLAVLLIIILFAGAGAFYYGLGIVRTYAEEVNQRLAEAETSSSQIDTAEQLSESVVDKAERLFAAPASFESQIRSDIQNYARDAGITIENASFSDANPQQLVVRIASPTSYAGLITFLHNIETNLPKMQVTALSLEHAENGTTDSVVVNEIMINVLVR